MTLTNISDSNEDFQATNGLMTIPEIWVSVLYIK